MENWKPVAGFESEYEVSDFGRIRSLDKEVNHPSGGTAIRRGRLLKLASKKNGYVYANLSSSAVPTCVSVHRLVAEHFLEAPQRVTFEVNHKDLNKRNNAASNLEWVTHKENVIHACKNGRMSAATNPSKARKLSLELVEKIRQQRINGATYKQLGALFGITGATAFKVVRGDVWAAYQAPRKLELMQ